MRCVKLTSCERGKLSRAARRPNRFSRTRAMHSTRSFGRPSRRLQRNPLQNPLEQQVSLISAVVTEAVFVQVFLQILRAHVVVDATDAALHSAPEPFNSLSVNVALNVDLCIVADEIGR